MSDRRDNIKYLLMVRSAEEGKQYLDENEEELKSFMKMGYATVGIGGYIMANEEAEPEKVAFILVAKNKCLKYCPFDDDCISKTIAEGCIKIEKIEESILALETRSRNVERARK